MTRHMQEPAPRHRTARQFAYEEIIKAITTGELPPGTRLNEQVLSEWLNVSRTPVREALSALDADEVVDLVPHQGAIVRTMDPQALREEYVVRAALESLAVELSVPRVPERVLDQLGVLNHDMEEAMSADRIDDFLTMNRELHLQLYEHCDSPRLLSLISSTWDREDIFRRYYYSALSARQSENHMHDELLDAYRRRAVVEARELVKQSLLSAGVVLAERLSLTVADPAASIPETPERYKS